jgi:hypothetical protein
MAVKITEKALREFVRNMLLEQQEGDDSAGEETNPPAVSTFALDKPDVPLDADPHVVDNTLGPPTADPGYLPEDAGELKAAVGKLLDDVPDSSVGTAYKIVKKTLDNLHSVLRQRAEINPLARMNMSESSSVEKLLFLISEQGLFPDLFDDEEDEEVEVRSATYDDPVDDKPKPPPPSKPKDVESGQSQFQRFFKKKMDDMLALAKARYPEKLQGVMDWNLVDNNLEPEEHLAVMDAYDEALGKKYPVLANSTGKDFEPPVKATLVAAVEAFMKDSAIQLDPEEEPPETGDRVASLNMRDMDLVDLKSKSAQDQSAKEALRRELFRMSIGSKAYYDGLIDILQKPDTLGDKKLQKSLDIALKDFSEEESMPESDSDYFLFIAYMNQDLRPDDKANYRNTVLNRAAEHMMSQENFAGAKGRAERPHINKDSTLSNVMAAVDGIKSRGDRSEVDRLEKLSDILNKMLPKGQTVPVINIRDEEPEEEAEEKTMIARSPGGKTFRRKRSEAEVAENITPAEAILRSSAVNPDLDKALALVKGIV